MISESQQEQATLYALELLDADEAAAFEREIGADAELSSFVRDLQETAALLAVAGVDEMAEAPPALRERVLAEVRSDRLTNQNGGGIKHVVARVSWLPWTIAALFLGCSGVLLWAYEQQTIRADNFHVANIAYQHQLLTANAEAARSASVDPLAQMSFCALEPTPDFATAQPRAAVLWDAAHQQGKLRVNRLAPPAEGRDYQLWTVEVGRKDAVSAGVVHVDADGKADISFRPVDADGKPVVAVAISLEQAGGSPTNQGPILLLGKF